MKNLIHEEVDAAKKDILAGIEKGSEKNAESFHEMLRKMDETNVRVTAIEDHVGLSEPHKNEVTPLKIFYRKNFLENLETV